MATLIFPLSRIEGHAQVSIEVTDGKVQSAQFQASEMRGFEHFVKGVPAEQMVVIVPRICGVCSTAHHVAAVEALEDAFGVTPSTSGPENSGTVVVRPDDPKPGHFPIPLYHARPVGCGQPFPGRR